MFDLIHHTICFVDDEEAQMLQVEAWCLADVVDKPARGSDDDVLLAQETTRPGNNDYSQCSEPVERFMPSLNMVRLNTVGFTWYKKYIKALEYGKLSFR